MDTLSIKLHPDGTITMVEEGVTAKEKMIEPEDLVNVVQDSVQNRITDRYGAILPQNCIYYGVVERRSVKPQKTFVLYREPRIAPYNHLGEIHQVGYPALIFAYCIHGSSVVSSAVAAVKDDIIKESTPVYYFPYGNAGPNGFICLGSFKYPPIEELSDATHFPESFLAIEHTHIDNGPPNQSISEIIAHNKEKHFDNDMLVFMTSFADFLNKFQGSDGNDSYVPVAI